MRVLFLYGSNSRNSGGLYNSVRSLGQSLFHLEGVEPVALAHSDEYSERDLPAYHPLRIEEYHIKGPANFGFSTDLSDKIREIRPDILHPQCIWMYSSLKTLQYHRKYDIPYLISPRGMLDKWILANGKFKKQVAGFLFEKAHVQNASCIHALGMPEYEAVRNFGYKKPIVVIPNGVHLPVEREDKYQGIPEWKGNDQRKVMLFLSRLHPKKGIENLIRAWSLAGSGKNDWRLVIAGETRDTQYQQSLVDLLAKLKLTNDIQLIGPQFHQDKDNCFRNADAFILPSFSEGLPMAILEAWSYKLPVVMTDACNIPEGFEKGAALHIMPDVDSIVQTLNKLFNMPVEQRLAIGEKGYELVKQKFTWPSIARQMKDVYQWILSGGTPPDTIKFT